MFRMVIAIASSMLGQIDYW